MSPVGALLRVRMRMFPSIVNCCNIDWLKQWPEEALQTVAEMNLGSVDFEGLNEESKKKLSSCCVFVHRSVEEMCDKFYLNLKRRVYITPKNYIDLLNYFKELLKVKEEAISSNKNKLSNGLYKLKEANEIIAELKLKLTELQPILQIKTVE